jgi:hypothetical protein
VQVILDSGSLHPRLSAAPACIRFPRLCAMWASDLIRSRAPSLDATVNLAGGLGACRVRGTTCRCEPFAS